MTSKIQVLRGWIVEFCMGLSRNQVMTDCPKIEIFHDVAFCRADQAPAGDSFESLLFISKASVFNCTVPIPKPTNGKYIVRTQCGLFNVEYLLT